MRNYLALVLGSLIVLSGDAQDSPIYSRVFVRRGMDEFRAGKVKESIELFETAARTDPELKPMLWQLGISYYYAGEFAKGRRLFELHQTVNPEDVENAIWHFLCVARAENIEAARKVFMPISQDTRVPMKELHAFFAGKLLRDDIIKAAQAGSPSESALKERLFYAHLYLGLYEEVSGHPKEALVDIRRAAEDYAQPDYMGAVAKIHLQQRRKD